MQDFRHKTLDNRNQDIHVPAGHLVGNLQTDDLARVPGTHGDMCL